jgi:hypothetical protein
VRIFSHPWKACWLLCETSRLLASCETCCETCWILCQTCRLLLSASRRSAPHIQRPRPPVAVLHTPGQAGGWALTRARGVGILSSADVCRHLPTSPHPVSQFLLDPSSDRNLNIGCIAAMYRTMCRCADALFQLGAALSLLTSRCAGAAPHWSTAARRCLTATSRPQACAASDHCTVPPCIACTALHCAASHCTVLHCTAAPLHCTALHLLHCSALCRAALHLTRSEFGLGPDSDSVRTRTRSEFGPSLICTVLHCAVLVCTALGQPDLTVLYRPAGTKLPRTAACNPLHCAALCCTVLHRAAPH